MGTPGTQAKSKILTQYLASTGPKVEVNEGAVPPMRCPGRRFLYEGRCVAECPPGTIDWQATVQATPMCSSGPQLEAIFQRTGLLLVHAVPVIKQLVALVKLSLDPKYHADLALRLKLTRRLRIANGQVALLVKTRNQAQRALAALDRGDPPRGSGDQGRPDDRDDRRRDAQDDRRDERDDDRQDGRDDDGGGGRDGHRRDDRDQR